MLQFLFALIALAGVAWLLSPPWLRQRMRERVRGMGLWIGLIVLVLLLVSGRMPWLLGVLGGAALLALRVLPLLRMLPWLRRLMGGGDAGATEGGKPLRGRYIQLWLEEDSGRMDGDVLRGNWRGWRLSRLSLGELEAILAVCEREDANSAALLKAYLERNHGRNTGPTSTAMSEAEARAILGVAQDADAETITQAHRRLIQRLHPDRGGSDALASRVNAAKRVLLGNRR